MYDFSADDVFEIADQLERNGADFYRTAAEVVDESGPRALLLKLAEMEEDHRKIFAGMRSALADEEKLPDFDLHAETVRYLKALADTRVFFEKEMDTSSMEAILKDAVIAEKDSIVFYLGMRDAVPEEKGRSRLNDIIKEEMGHIVLLSKELKALEKPGT
ncbi:MAG: ferritin family protein [Desulfobacteraceae bacterium]